MVSEEAQAMPFWRRLLAGWQAIAGRFGAVQTLVILALFYVLLIGPVSIVTFVARRDFLHKRGLRATGSAWLDADSAAPDLERAKLTT
jgi:hypothetical protein